MRAYFSGSSLLASAVVVFMFFCFFFFCAVGSVRIGAHEPLSFRATFADGWNRMSTCCEPYGGGSVPELSNDCAQPSVSGVTRLIHQTNNSGSLTFFSHAKLLLLSADGSAVLVFLIIFFFFKSFRICHMALENSITTKNGDYHVALCGLAASLKIFM